MNDQELICPICEQGGLRPVLYNQTFQHHGTDLCVNGLEGYVCAHCGADPVFEDQIRRNHARVLDARRRADGLLTADEIRSLRNRLGLTQQEAAQLFGAEDSAFSKYERSEVMQSATLDRLLRLVGRHPQLLADLPAREVMT